MVNSGWLPVINVFSLSALKSPMKIHSRLFPGTNIKFARIQYADYIFLPLLKIVLFWLYSLWIPLFFLTVPQLWIIVMMYSRNGLIWKPSWSRLGCEARSAPQRLIVRNAKSSFIMWEEWGRWYMWRLYQWLSTK